MNTLYQNAKDNQKARWIKKFAKLGLYLFLIGFAALIAFPVIMTILGSFKSNTEITAGATFLPKEWMPGNYADAWKQADFALFTWNSFFVSTAATLGTIIVASMAAYAVDRRNFWGKRLYTTLQAFTMFISIGAVVLKPQFDLMVKFHLNTSLWGVILILIASHATSYFMLTGFIKSIPKDLDEAALIDGSSFMGIYWRIVLPLLRPGLAVVGLFAFRHAWNEYILPLVFTLNSPHLQTLTVGLANLRYGTNAAMQTNLMLAGACLSILPVLLVYLFANKQFMKVTAGSIKG